MRLPVVTVITLTYKNFEGLQKTVESVLSQDYPKIEYMIADDGSDNFDSNLIHSTIEKYKKSNLINFQMIHQENNMGTVKNANNAVKKATGEYIIYLGLDDTFVDRNVISRIINRMKNNNDDIICFSRILCDLDNNPIRLMPCQSFYKSIDKMSNYKAQYRAFVTGFHYEMASGSGVCVKKSLLEKMNYYDEDYVYWEDGPFFSKCNLNLISIPIAYDIVGINYKKGGISSSKSKVPSKALLGLRKDADSFYRNEYMRNSGLLSVYDRRIIHYSLERYKSKDNKYIIMAKYVDVVFIRIMYKCKMKIAGAFATSFFKKHKNAII